MDSSRQYVLGIYHVRELGRKSFQTLIYSIALGETSWGGDESQNDNLTLNLY